MRNFLARSNLSLFCVGLILALSLRAVAAGPPVPKPSAPPQAASTAAKETLERSAQSANQTAPARARVAHPPPETPNTAAPSNDAAIERAIQARFARSKISSNGFTVRVSSGIAVLEGNTSVIQHKGTATRLAKSAGARRVDNRIQISEAARQRAAAHFARVRKN